MPEACFLPHTKPDESRWEQRKGKSMVTSVVFDMDGVLFDTERVYIRAWGLAAEKLGKEAAGWGARWQGKLEKAMLDCIGLNAADTVSYFDAHLGKEFPREAYFAETRQRFSAILAEEGIPLKEGAEEILPYLKERGVRVALATSTNEKTAREQLTRVGLIRYFEEFVFGDMVEHSKPDPEIYRKACAQLGMPPEKCIAVEDSYNGIRSAYRAGMKPVMVPDLLEPDDAIAPLLFWRCESLLMLKNRLEVAWERGF